MIFFELSRFGQMVLNLLDLYFELLVHH